MSASAFGRTFSVSLIAVGLVFVCLSSPLATGQTTEGADAHLARGTRLLQAGDLGQAKAEFQTAAHLNPRSPQAYLLLGIAENQLGDFPTAVRNFREALKLNPRSDAAHYNLALSLLRLERIDEAIGELEEAVKLNARLDVAQYNLGVLLTEKGRFQESIEHLEAARAVRPNDSAISVHLVEAYLRADNDPRALELAQKVIREDSKGDTSAELGAFLAGHGYFEQAIPAIEKARSFAPESSDLAVLLARTYLGTNRPDEALRLLEALPDYQPSWQVKYLLGLAYTANAQSDQAAQSLREAVRLKPDEPGIHYTLGKLLLKSAEEQDQTAGAEEIQRAISLNPRKADYYATLGRWLLEKTKLQPAADLFKGALDKTAPSAELYLMLGLTESELHGAGAAMPYVQKSVELNPEAAPAYNLLGNLYLRLGDQPDSAKSYKQAAELSPRNALYSYNAALALERLDRIAEALRFVEKSVELEPNQPFYRYMLGKLNLKFNRMPEAIRELEACVRLDPKLEYPYFLLARTYMRLGDVRKAQEWSHKLEGLKEEKDRAVGLLAPASELQPFVDSSIPLSETSVIGARPSARGHP